MHSLPGNHKTTTHQYQWRSKDIWRPGANLNFALPPQKMPKNDNKMSDRVYNYIGVAYMYILRILTWF